MKNKSRGLLAVVVVLLSVIGVFFLMNRPLKIGLEEEQPLKESATDASSDQATTNNSSITDTLNKNNEKIRDKKESLENEKLKALLSQSYYFAIYGTDERGEEIPRSDVIMVIKFIPSANQLIMVSIPRDTRVDIPGRGLDKINHTYAFGGASLLSRTLEDLLQCEIDYYIKLSFDNFQSFIDSVGGVAVVAQKHFSYPNYIEIPKGPQVLTGEKALEYVRFRYDEQGDYGRIQRQQEVLVSLLEKYRKSDAQVSEDTLQEFYSKIQTNMSFDNIQNFQKIIKVVEVSSYDPYTLQTKGSIINGIWYEIVDDESLEEMRNVLKRP